MNAKFTPISRVQGGPYWRFVFLLFVLMFLIPPGNGLLGIPVMAAPVGRVAHAVNPGCIDLIADGDFEQFSPAWQIQASNRPPAYSTQQVFSGQQSMRIGNGIELPDIASVSEVRHRPVLLPAGATSLILRFVYWPFYESTPGTDLQQVDLFDAATDQLILPLLNIQDNKRDWKVADYDLTAYAGREISLRFRVLNDGQPGRTLLYIDNVELEYCAATPIPTYTPTSVPATGTVFPTWTATAPGGTFTPLPTLTPTPLATLPPPTVIPRPPAVIPTADPACPNILENSGFEEWGGWHFGEDPVPGQYVANIGLNGSSAVLLGNPPGYRADVKSFSSIRQLVTIPYSATRAELRWWKWLGTEQAGYPGSLTDRQDVVFLDVNLNVLDPPYRELQNTNDWQEDSINLNRYRGRTFYVYFNAFNDGNGQRTWMYLDNVQLNVCDGNGYGTYGNLVSTPIAIPLPPSTAYTPIPFPTSSPSPTPVVPTQVATQVATPVFATAVPTVAPVMPTATEPLVAEPTGVEPTPAAIGQVTATPIGEATLPATVATIDVEPTTNVYALPTATPSFLVETATAIVTATATISGSGITAQPTSAIIVTPAPATTRPAWLDRLGPISVLLGVLVLIGFIVWAILQTFRGNQP